LTMMTDPIADMLTRIRNAVAAGQQTLEMRTSNTKERIAGVLKREGFIEDYRVVGDAPKKILKIYLAYGRHGERVITEIKRVSRPGRRVYSSAKDIPYVRNGLGILVVSTSRGLMSDMECRRQNVGGEVLCSVF